MLKLGRIVSDKKGISIMIGYIILITMGITLSVVVFNWLSFYVPTQDADLDECPESVSVTLKNVVCDSTNTNLSFTIKNNGLFSIDGFRVGVNDKEGSELGIYEIDDIGVPISPENEYYFEYDYESHVAGLFEPYFESNLQLVEVRPIYLVDGGERVCSSIRELLVCDIQPEVCIGGDDEDQDGATDCADSDCTYDPLCASSDLDIFLYLTFDSVGNELADSSFYGNDATIYGTQYQYESNDGYNGRGIYKLSVNPAIADASIELLDSVTADSMHDTFSLSVVFKNGKDTGASPVLQDARLFSRDCSRYWCVRIDQGVDSFGQNMDFYTDTIAGNRGNDIDVGMLDVRRWHHFVGVWDAESGTAEYYLDGVSVWSSSYDPTSFFTGEARSIVFGSDQGASIPETGDNQFNGWIDDIIIYNRSLTAEEVTNLYDYFDSTSLCGLDSDCPQT